MKIKLLLQIALVVLVMVSCEEPLDPIVKAVNNTTDLLQRHVWNLEEFAVKVRDDDNPLPVLFSDTDSQVRSDIYHLDDMVYDASRQVSNRCLPSNTQGQDRFRVLQNHAATA